MANVIGNGTVSQIADVDGDPITTTNRFPVETEQDDAFGTFVNYPDFAVETSTAQALNHANHTGVSIEDAKEIVIQTDDANTGYIMVGYSAGTTLVGSVGSRAGIKLNGGETLVLAWSTFATVFLIASASTQYVNIAYFK
tara:strand:+ start:338 stop:757 length:420 start_codon:yes stop_codon:yes gene_type:complete